MGSKFAPTFANLVMGFLETKLYQLTEELISPNCAQYIKVNLLRFLDDCFIIWDNNLADINRFITILNSLHQDIHFTTNISKHQVNFLDVLIINGNDRIITDVYTKPTDTKQYLNFNSCHPKHTKINIPFNLARRICMIVNEGKLREMRLRELREDLRRQHYPKTVIEAGIKKAVTIPINILREKKPPDLNHTNKTLPFVTTHNPHHNVFHTINSGYNIFLKNNKMGEILKNHKIINCKRQTNNLKRILTRAAFTDKKEKYTTYKCGEPRCKTCHQLIITSEFKTDIQSVVLNANMSCISRNLIYILLCNGCQEIYVGETGDLLRTRINVHRQHISHCENAPLRVSSHINACGRGENILNKFSVLPIFKISPYVHNPNFRKEKENHFIQLLKPKLNVM